MDNNHEVELNPPFLLVGSVLTRTRKKMFVPSEVKYTLGRSSAAPAYRSEYPGLLSDTSEIGVPSAVE